jgi:hypothetical protein
MLLLNDDRQKISNETSKHLGAKNACILETLTGVTAEDSRRIETHYLVILATIIVQCTTASLRSHFRRHQPFLIATESPK